MPPFVIADGNPAVARSINKVGLERNGYTPERLEATAAVSLDNVPPQGWTVTASHLVLTATVPGLDAVRFGELAAKAKANCPISRLLNAAITLDAKLA